jgi:hypothetical protein
LLKNQQHIFISYAREDRARVAVLAQLFEAEGWLVWWDRDNLPAGQQFDQIIDQAIDEAVCVLVCWSLASVDSGWVIAEANEGLDQKKLLPVYLETVRMPLRFRPYHAIDLSGWNGLNSHDDYRRLKAELQRWQLPLNGQVENEDSRGNELSKTLSAAVEIPLPQISAIKNQLTPEARKLLVEFDSSETNPKRRLKIGDELNDMEGGDPRFGVGLNEDGLPEIDWVEIPAGEFLYGEEILPMETETFYIARYPITNEQYDAFIKAGGYKDEHWWAGLSGRFEKPKEPAWKQSNRPRETVSWYEAIAFCRWLSEQVGYEVQLPTELQWERAARSTDGVNTPGVMITRVVMRMLMKKRIPMMAPIISNKPLPSACMDLLPHQTAYRTCPEMCGNGF